MSQIELFPMSLADARRFVAETHRHNEPPRGHKFSIGLREQGIVTGAVVASRPVARGLDDGVTLEITRLSVGPDHDRNACSRLYGAACRAAEAMGYRRVITYTLAEEPGTSLRASGFVEDARLPARERSSDWSQTETMSTERLWEPAKMPTGPKIRWLRTLATKEAPSQADEVES